LLGYLVAGVLVGPATPGFVADPQLTQQLADIGVILLMFGVGLHLTPGDLLPVRRVAITGAIVQVLVVAALGFLMARLWSWTTGASLVFGLSLSVASTVVVLRTFEERGLIKSLNACVALGWLIVQDILMVLVLALVPVLGSASQ